MSRTDPQLKVRLPLEIKEKIEKAATQNHRSMNAEIVARLQHTIMLDAQEAEIERIEREDMEPMPGGGFSNINAWKRQMEAAIQKVQEKVQELDELEKNNKRDV